MKTAKKWGSYILAGFVLILVINAPSTPHGTFHDTSSSKSTHSRSHR